MKFSFIDPETKKDVIKYNVLERRESDSSEKDWRICKLDWFKTINKYIYIVKKFENIVKKNDKNTM